MAASVIKNDSFRGTFLSFFFFDCVGERCLSAKRWRWNAAFDWLLSDRHPISGRLTNELGKIGKKKKANSVKLFRQFRSDFDWFEGPHWPLRGRPPISVGLTAGITENPVKPGNPIPNDSMTH